MKSFSAAVVITAVGWAFLNPQGPSRERPSPTRAPPPDASAPRSETGRAAERTRPTGVDDDVLRILQEADDAGGPASDSTSERHGDDAVEDGVATSEGPWGTLQSYNVYIGAPDHIVALFQVPSAVTAWNFPAVDEAGIRSLFDRPDIPESARRELLDRSRWTVTDGGIQVTPSDAAVLSLSPSARAAIYRTLAASEMNEFQHAPYFVPDGDVDAWLGGVGLREELIDVIRQTVYPAGRAFCFSDVALVVARSKSHAEARIMLKALSRTRTAILRLQLDDESDLPRIARYWSSGAANAKDFMPILESTATNHLVKHLDIIHVLPPYARKLMYTYPHPSLAIGGRYPDCHWTSLNFFNYRPEGRLFDTDGATMFTVENFTPGELPYRYGDVLFFTNAAGHAIHSCVFLADDYVFTKNGANLISPWLVMKLAEVVDRYSVDGEPTIRIYRKNL